MKITNHDLHIMLTEMRKDIKYIVTKSESLEEWQKEHEERDEKRFASLNRYATSIAVVASGIGAMGTYIWQKFAGKI